jgi:hypothetical protein
VAFGCPCHAAAPLPAPGGCRHRLRERRRRVERLSFGSSPERLGSSGRSGNRSSGARR